MTRRHSYQPRTDVFLTAEQVAAKFNLTTEHVYQLARDRRLPCVRIGRYVRFSRLSLAKWIVRRKPM